MKELILRDDRELRRIEMKIATIESGAPLARLRNSCLLAALKAERDELLRIGGRAGRPRRPLRSAA